MKKHITLALILAVIFPALAFALQDNKVDPGAINVPEGYSIEAVVTGLSLPTTAIFDGEDLIVAESGFLDTAKPRILRIKTNKEVTTIAEEGLIPPVTGLAIDDGTLYVSHKGKVSKLENGKLVDIVINLPSQGDHQNNNIVIGKDGRIYLGQGTVTNSGVVGIDNYVFGWLDKNPNIHDVPCYDISLTGKNYETDNLLTKEDDKVMTGAYKPFGMPSKEGEVIKGDKKCNGSILSFKKDGSDLKVEAWGLRNPFGLEFDQAGSLWATFHGADVRGSRNIFNDPDYFIKVEKGGWYGWPDYFNGKPVTDSQFKSPTNEAPTFLWQSHPELSLPFVTIDSHSATNGFAFSPSDAFGFKGDAFIATFGSFTPITTGINVELSGYSVIRVDMKNKKVEKFATNEISGPSYINRLGGFNRPSDIVFGPDDSMYVVDWGGAKLGNKGLELKPETGVVWRIFNNQTQAPKYQNGPIVVPADPTPEESHGALARNDSETYKMVLSRFWPILLGLLILIFVVKKLKR